MAIDDFQIKRFGTEYFPTGDVCAELMRNGDASLDPMSPYPFYPSSSSAALTIQEESNGNKYFRLSGRKDKWVSPRQRIGTECLAPEMVFELSFKSRASAALSIQSRFIFVTKRDDGSNQYHYMVAAYCTTGVNEWKECKGEITMNRPELFSGQPHDFFTDVYMLDDKTTSIDFDDFSFKFLSGPAGGFVVNSEGVDGCWQTGSKVLITSDTMYYEDDTIATIKAVTTEGSMTTLSFEEDLAPRSSKADSIFPVELALMERNIKFESDNAALGEGGHFAVWQTPQAQVLDGVEFYKFGQQGTLGRYVSVDFCSNNQLGNNAN